MVVAKVGATVAVMAVEEGTEAARVVAAMEGRRVVVVQEVVAVA